MISSLGAGTCIHCLLESRITPVVVQIYGLMLASAAGYFVLLDLIVLLLLKV